MNCHVVPSAIEGSVGVTAIEMRTAELTASPVEPLIPLAESVAPMLVKPIATLVAKPALPRPLLAVATPVFDELQVTALVKSCGKAVALPA